MVGRPYGSHRIAMDDSDEALMARVARGDERAFQLLSRRHLPAMLGLARRILGNAGDAEDVAQEAFMRVWTHAPRWQPLAQFRTWLTRVVVNLCLDRKRRGTLGGPRRRRRRGRSWAPGGRKGRERRAWANAHGGDRQASRAPARRNHAHLYGRHEQCAGGGNSRRCRFRRSRPC